MRYANIIHLSDLHLTQTEPSQFNQSLITEALVEDLIAIRDTQLRPDCILFTGDIVNSADEAGIFKNATELLNRIAEAAGLDSSKVFVCPGNHDSSREKIGPKIPQIKAMRDRSTTVDNLNSLSFDSNFIEHVSTAFASFSNFSSAFGKEYQTSSDAIVTQYYMREINLAIICINTAALSGGGLSSDVEDERKIAVPEASLARALKRVPEGAQIVLAGHHPIAFLNENSSSLLQPLILEKVDVYASGHLHAATPLSIAGPTGQCTYVQAGSLYGSRQWWNGYGIISLVPGQPHHRLTYRKWHEARRKFGVASDLDDEGIVYNSADGKTFWATVTPKLDVRRIEKWRIETFLPHLEDEFGADFVEMYCQSTFVPPEFEKDVYVETESGLEKTTKVETIDLSTLMASQDNLVIMAQSETGKTTLIRHWAFKAVETRLVGREWSIPACVKFSEFKNYIKGNEGIIRKKVPNLPEGISIEDLLTQGLITIFVDDMDIRASQAKSAFDDFALKYPSCRYVLLTGTVFLQGAGIAPVIVADLPFSHLRLKQLKQSQLLTLIENHGTKDPAQADRLLHRMVQEASSLNVPITPVTGTFFIQIYTEDASQPLINRANLIERYVEISLEKFAPQELLPNSFDFHNKSDLLSFVSEHMCRSDIHEIPEQQFINLISEYMTEFGLNFSAIDLLEYFVRARVLQKAGAFISYRLNAFQEYFSAVRMVNHQIFREWVLSESRYLQFPNEIAFYAAMSRRDQGWLETLFTRFKENSAQVWDAMPPDVKSAALIEKFVLPANSAKEADVLDVERKIFDNPLAEEDRRAILDGEDPIVPAPTSQVRRQLATDPSEKWLAQLIMLSSMLKNMELVPSPLKKMILRDVIHGWLQFLCISMGSVPTLAKHKRLRIAGIEYIVLFPEEMDLAEVARRLFLFMPISTAKMATHHLGTEKLRVQLEEGIGSDESEFSAGQQFMRSTILAQLGVEGLSKIVARAADTLSEKGYLSSVFVRMLSEVVVRFRLPELELRQIRLVAADTIARIEGKTGQGAARRKGQVIESLAHKRMTLGLIETKGDQKRK